MPSFDISVIVLLGITFFAAFVNGALGYGFSSLTVPVALVFYTNRILNPALVLVEVFVNLYVLFINRKSIPLVLLFVASQARPACKLATLQRGRQPID